MSFTKPTGQQASPADGCAPDTRRTPPRAPGPGPGRRGRSPPRCPDPKRPASSRHAVRSARRALSVAASRSRAAAYRRSRADTERPVRERPVRLCRRDRLCVRAFRMVRRRLCRPFHRAVLPGRECRRCPV